MMNALQVERRWHVLPLLLAIALLFMMGASQAQADEEKSFCSGKYLEYQQSCESAKYPDMYAVYASSPEGNPCVELTNPGLVNCGSGVYVGLHMGESFEGRARIINLSSPMKVWGTFWRRSWHMDDLGGSIAGPPTLASWGENRLDLFAKGADPSALYHKWWGGSAWSAWEATPGGSALASAPGAVSWGPNRIDVAALGNPGGFMQHWYWDGTRWNYDSLGGSGFKSAPDIASWGSGRLDVFAKGSDNTLWTKSWNGTAWSGWSSLGGPELLSAPAAVSWGPYRIDVVARVPGSNGDELGHWWWDGSWHYQSLGTPPGGLTMDPDIASTESGKLFVYVRDGEGYVRQRVYDGYQWSGWPIIFGPVATSPTAVAWGPYRLDVAAGDPVDGSVLHWYWNG